MLKKLFILISVLLFSKSLQASHLIGGDITYTHLGGNNYQIKLQLFRDCSDSKDFDNPVAITIYESNGAFIVNRLVPLSFRNKVANIPDPCLIPPPGICVERGVFIDTVSLSNSIYGYDISYEACCHNASILNIQFPQFTGITITSHVPAISLATYNTSVQFDSVPPVFVCVNSPFAYDFSVIDIDGDSLVYNLCTPFDGLSGNPASPPPYSNISWASGYSATNPIPSSSTIIFNQQTGQLSLTPSMIGQFAIGVCISEYRNGNLINTNRKEIQLNAVACETVASIPIQTIFCNGTTIDFQNSSTNSTSYFWDFGEPSNLSDTSRLTSPTYTYADTGTYQVMLVALNNNGTCRDTAYTNFQIYPLLAPAIPPNYTQCFNNNNFSFQLNGTYSTDATFSWNFSNRATPNSSSMSIPTSIIFDTLGIHPVSVIISQYGCSDTLNSTVKILQSPIASFYSLDTVGCQPLSSSLINTSVSQTPLQYTWLIENINDTIVNPNHIFYNPGLFSIQLVAIDTNGCFDTLIKNNYIKVNPNPQAIASVDPEETEIIHSNINFSDQTQGSHLTFFDLGDGYSETQLVFQHVYSDIGTYNWTLTVTNDFGCKDTTSGIIKIRETNLIYIPNSFTPNNDGVNDEFKPVIAYYKNVTLQIFNRWGNSIFMTNNIEKGWNGNFKNSDNLCQIDTYIYKLNVIFFDSSEKEYTGIVTLTK